MSIINVQTLYLWLLDSRPGDKLVYPHHIITRIDEDNITITKNDGGIVGKSAKILSFKDFK